MQTQEAPATSPAAGDKISEHEDAAHEKRNWVRLTFDCNNRCVFCLDSDTHDGEIRNREEVKQQILDGRRNGATRLILSGGEPTIHPNYVDFIKLGAKAGYRKIQTVTNGRLFAYPGFLKKCLDAGLSEITFSVHGPNARIHDALVGVKGAFEQEIQGLKLALADGRPIVNIDIVINRGNVKQLPEMLRIFTEMGVREFDLLHVIPFGRAFTEGRETLFYNLEEMRPYLLEAFAYSKLPDMHIWLNRFPPQHLEGYENLIQDPYKLNDEVRGRKEEYARLLDEGTNLDCREPHRCQYCYLEQLCDKLDVERETVNEARFDVVRVDTEWEAHLPPVFGGDPASARRARHEQEDGGPGHHDGVAEQSVTVDPAEKKRSLPILGGRAAKKIEYLPLDALVEKAGARALWLVAPTVARAAEEAGRFASVREVELELESYAGLAEALGPGGTLAGKKLVRALARDAAQAEELLAVPGDFEVVVELSRRNAPWLLARASELPARVVLRQPTHERLTESAQQDVDLREFFAAFAAPVAVEGVPACVLGRPPRKRPRVLDTAVLTPEGRLEIFRYTRRYILANYMTRSLRCKTCVHFDNCDGMHINYVRAHGYAVMQPVGADAE